MDRFIVIAPERADKGSGWWVIVDANGAVMARYWEGLPGAEDYARVCALRMNTETQHA